MSEQEEKRLSNLASERAVLAGVFNHGIEAFVDIEHSVTESCFTYDPNKVLFKCVKAAIKKGDNIGLVEILSSAESLGLSEYIQNKDVIKHVNGVINTPVALDHVHDHALKIRRLEFARKVQGELRGIYLELNDITGEESLTHILSLAEQPIQEISLSYMREDENTPQLIGEGLEEYIQHVMENKSDQIGISTGYSSWDKSIGGGLRRKCVDLIAARTKAGKSVFADNVALHIARDQNIPVLMLDTEMSTEDHYRRLVANLSGVEVNDIGSGQFSDNPEDVNKVMAAVEILREIPYHYINISGRPFEESLSIARRWILKNVGYDENGVLNDCVLIYDYLKLMNGSEINNNMAEFQVLGFQITSLHNFTVQYDIACLALVQANREGITKESSDIVSGSDRLAWLCTSLSQLKEKSVEEAAADGPMAGNRKMVTIISRHGPGTQNNGYICLNMEGEFARLTELGTVSEIGESARNDAMGIAEYEEDEIEMHQNDSDIPEGI